MFLLQIYLRQIALFFVDYKLIYFPGQLKWSVNVLKYLKYQITVQEKAQQTWLNRC